MDPYGHLLGSESRGRAVDAITDTIVENLTPHHQQIWQFILDWTRDHGVSLDYLMMRSVGSLIAGCAAAYATVATPAER
jgi:hypothetical protein